MKNDFFHYLINNNENLYPKKIAYERQELPWIKC